MAEVLHEASGPLRPTAASRSLSRMRCSSERISVTSERSSTLPRYCCSLSVMGSRWQRSSHRRAPNIRRRLLSRSGPLPWPRPLSANRAASGAGSTSAGLRPVALVRVMPVSSLTASFQVAMRPWASVAITPMGSRAMSREV